MSLKIPVEMASEKQLDWLTQHNYYGTFELTKTEATRLIEEYIEQERMEMSRSERDFVKFLNAYDPEYLIRYRRIKKGMV